jgi:hypothetical protein
LSITNLETRLRLLPDDDWALDNFHADFAGARFNVRANIANASAIREWRFLKSTGPRKTTVRLHERLARLADTLERIHFAAPPEIQVAIDGDARDLQSLLVRMNLRAPDANTPWGTFQEGYFSLRLLPPTTNTPSRAEMVLTADSAETRWGSSTNLHLRLTFAPSPTVAETNVVQADLRISSDGTATRWGRGTNVQLTAQWLHALTNAVPLSGQAELQAGAVETERGKAATLDAHLTLVAPEEGSFAASDESWGWWTNVAPYALNVKARVTALASPKLNADELDATAQWRAPMLHVSRLTAQLYDGDFECSAGVNVATRESEFAATANFDAQKLTLLTEKGRRWINQFSWHVLPEGRVEGGVTLPSWTNFAHANWRGEALPTLRLNGEFKLQDGTFRGLQADSAQSHFSYSNMWWHLPDLVVTRPEGRLDLVHRADDRSRDFYWHIRSAIDVRAVRPLLGTNEQRALDYFEFTQPPRIDGEVWGNFRDNERIGFKGRIALTNFAFRAQTADACQTELEFTNRFLKLFSPHLWRGPQEFTAASAAVDFRAQKLFLTNGFSTVEPLVVAYAIGPKAGKAFEPYRFLQRPTVRGGGVIPLREQPEADLQCEVEGGAFQWWKFNVPRISGKLHWLGDDLLLNDLQTDFYGGRATGLASFDLGPGKGTDFSFHAIVTNANFHSLMADIATRSNKLEGTLSGQLNITQANSDDWRTWQGSGHAKLRDGLIWEIPVFGYVSPALDSIIPGLGSARASDATGSFAITNGVIRSEDLEIRASIMRLQYSGQVTLQGQTDARVEAELLRDTWVIGRLMSWVLWPVSKIFEYKVTGPLEQPKLEPVFFIPKILLAPFHPIKTIKDLIPDESNLIKTNTPAIPK